MRHGIAVPQGGRNSQETVLGGIGFHGMPHLCKGGDGPEDRGEGA